MSSEHVELMSAALDAFNAGDPDRMGADLAPDARIVPLRAALEDTVYTGPNAAREFWDASMQAWSALHVDVAELRDLGNRVLALGQLTGTARETGAQVEMQVGFIMTFERGKGTEIRTFTSQREALEVAGD